MTSNTRDTDGTAQGGAAALAFGDVAGALTDVGCLRDGAGTVLARELLARAEDVREIETVVAADNKASLRMLAALGGLRSNCVGGSCDIVVRVDQAGMAAAA